MNCPHCGSGRQEVVKIIDQLLLNEVPFLGIFGFVHATGRLMICHSCENKFLERGEWDAVIEVPKEKD